MQIAGFILQSLKLIRKVLYFFRICMVSDFLIGLAEWVMRITGIPFLAN